MAARSRSLPAVDRRPVGSARADARSGLATRLGCVAIGRNEGDRLRRCIGSLRGSGVAVVYVDSASTDDSTALAASLGAEVVHLDMSKPFTAARARNAGFRALLDEHPDLEFVQFVDGDCEIDGEWLGRGVAHLDAHRDLGIVCGRQREEFPDRNLFHRLFDVEWDAPLGRGTSCTGNTMVRSRVFDELGGFREDLIAGEEPELCVRMRNAGYDVERIDSEMAVHDANMTRFRQWWRRAVRAGHAFAEGAHLQGRSAERHNVSECRRIWLWGLLVPIVIVSAAVPTGGAALLMLSGYAVPAFRAFHYYHGRGRTRQDAAIAGVMMTIGKFAELRGMLSFHTARLTGRRRKLIEYRGSPEPARR